MSCRTVVLALLVLAAPVGAEAEEATPSAPLPTTLTGRWTVVGPAGVFTDSFSVTFDGDRQPGEVTGRASFRGVSCGSKDEPFRGTWDGREVRIQSMHRANVNTQRTGNAQCGAATYVLRPRPGAASFTGEGRMDGSNAVATFELSP